MKNEKIILLSFIFMMNGFALYFFLQNKEENKNIIKYDLLLAGSLSLGLLFNEYVEHKNKENEENKIFIV